MSRSRPPAGTPTGDQDTGDGDGDPGDGDGDGDTGDGDGDGDVPEFGETFTVIGTAADGLSAPRDLDFAPGAPNQLWTFNTGIHGTVIYFDPGTDQQTSELRVDAYGAHFMAFVAAAAFGDNGNFSSCQESRDEWNVGPQPPDDFMGPTLWSADLDVFAVIGQDFPPNGPEGSHLDILHQSPLCMGIAHDVDNVYWVFDGFNGNIVRYDFQGDHGPGGGDHSATTGGCSSPSTGPATSSPWISTVQRSGACTRTRSPTRSCASIPSRMAPCWPWRPCSRSTPGRRCPSFSVRRSSRRSRRSSHRPGAGSTARAR